VCWYSYLFRIFFLWNARKCCVGCQKCYFFATRPSATSRKAQSGGSPRRRLPGEGPGEEAEAMLGRHQSKCSNPVKSSHFYYQYSWMPLLWGLRLSLCYVGARGSVVGWEALCYKLEGRGFDSLSGHCIFKLNWSFQLHCGPGVDSASNRNQYQESSWGVKVRPERKADNLTAICEPIV
jgi:hypothetical protein